MKSAQTAPTGGDFLPPTKRRELMQRIKAFATRPERILGEALGALRIQFEVNARDLPGKPDFVIRADKLAIFVDGELWHGRQWRKRGLRCISEQFARATQRDYWIEKIRRTCRRDLRQTEELLSMGWRVLRYWAGDVETRTSEIGMEIVRAMISADSGTAASLVPAKTVAEFFAGIGLARLGLAPDDWKVSYANDRSPDKVSFYTANHSASGSLLDPRDLNQVAAGEVPTVTLATACFPCTDLSLAGAQRGIEEGRESSAYLTFTKILAGLGRRRPPFVLLENVVGMLQSRGGADFKVCLQKLADAGYTVDPVVVDAKWFLPQSRPRLFVIAVRNDLPTEHLPVDHESVTDCALRPRRLLEFIRQNTELPWALRPLPQPKIARAKLEDILENIPEADARWWSADRTNRLRAQMSARHRQVVEELLERTSPGYATVFRRMRNNKSMAEVRTDGIAGCLRTPKGGSGRQILLKAHNGEVAVRLFTPTECAALMGANSIQIPKDCSDNKALFAFGDGVCVPVVRWISQSYLMPLASELIRGCLLDAQWLKGRRA